MFKNFGHDDDVIGDDGGPGGGIGGVVEVEVDVPAAELAGEAVVEVTEGIDGGLRKSFLEQERLMGEADIEEAAEGTLAFLNPMQYIEEELIAALMEL
jgi:hypothetical protein